MSFFDNDTREAATGNFPIGLVGWPPDLFGVTTWGVVTSTRVAPNSLMDTVSTTGLGSATALPFEGDPDPVDWFSLGVSLGVEEVEFDFFFWSQDSFLKLERGEIFATSTAVLHAEGATGAQDWTLTKTVGLEAARNEIETFLTALSGTFEENIDPGGGAWNARNALIELYSDLIEGVYSGGADDRGRANAALDTIIRFSVTSATHDAMRDVIDEFFTEKRFLNGEEFTFDNELDIRTSAAPGTLYFSVEGIEERGSVVDGALQSRLLPLDYGWIDLNATIIDWNEISAWFEDYYGPDTPTIAQLQATTAAIASRFDDDPLDPGVLPVVALPGGTETPGPLIGPGGPDTPDTPDTPGSFGTIRGTDGPDALDGREGMETIYGLDGDDTLRGGEGDDTLVGGDGVDTLHGQGGDDLLIGSAPVEASDTPGGQIYRLYRTTLDRAPDTGGFARWVDHLEAGTRDLLEVATGFIASREFQTVYGDLNDIDFVTLLYDNVLDRSPDAGGLDGWLRKLSDGTTREKVVIGFSESVEFKGDTALEAAAHAGALAGRMQAGFLDDVFRLYGATLDRAPDSEGLANWSGRLAEGQSYVSIAGGFTNSTEFRTTYGTLEDADFVRQLYDNVLDRPADGAGLNDWLNRIEGGSSREEVVRGFAQSREFIDKTQAGFQAYMAATDGDFLKGGAGDDTLAGGFTADTFAFDAREDGVDTVLQLDAWDTLRFVGFGYDEGSDVLAEMTVSGPDVLFTDQGVDIVFSGVDLGRLEAVDYLFA